MWIFHVLSIIGICAQSISAQATPAPEPYYGTSLGSLSDPQSIGIKGDVYVVNSTTVQVIGFHYPGGVSDLYFWFDKSDMLTEYGFKILTFEFGDQPLKKTSNASLVLWVPQESKESNPMKNYLNNFKTFGLWSQSLKKDYGSVSIPDTVKFPKLQFLLSGGGIIQPTNAGRRYNVESGPIVILDRRRLKIYGFKFDGQRAPVSHLFVGRGPEPTHKNGVKVSIRGYESPNFGAKSISKNYTGNDDIIVDLPGDYDIYHIDWLSVFCSIPFLDLGHVKIRPEELDTTIPPYVPLQQKYDHGKPWPLNLLSGQKKRTFTFQLGPPGFDRSYGLWAREEPARWLWYVNGYMTPRIYLQRGIEYTFVVEGGDQLNENGLINALYITDTSQGGYGYLPDDQKQNAVIYAGLKNGKPLSDATGRSFGRICSWIPKSRPVNSDDFDSFKAFRENLKLKCEDGKNGTFQWTPDKTTPNTLWYQSYGAANMGFQIWIMDGEIPSSIQDGPDVPVEDDYTTASPFETEDREDESLGSDEVQKIGGTAEIGSKPNSGRRESSSAPDENTNPKDTTNGNVTNSVSPRFWKASEKSFHSATVAFLFTALHLCYHLLFIHLSR